MKPRQQVHDEYCANSIRLKAWEIRGEATIFECQALFLSGKGPFVMGKDEEGEWSLCDMDFGFQFLAGGCGMWKMNKCPRRMSMRKM